MVNVRAYNFAVEEDESYVLGGLVSHNCRCTVVYVPRERAKQPYTAKDREAARAAKLAVA